MIYDAISPFEKAFEIVKKDPIGGQFTKGGMAVVNYLNRKVSGMCSGD